jgi:lysyl-tRNA synthetase class II
MNQAISVHAQAYSEIEGLERRLKVSLDESWLSRPKNTWLLHDFLSSWDLDNGGQLRATMEAGFDAAVDWTYRQLRDWNEVSEELDANLTAHYMAENFERVAEPALLQPTFITDFPKVISPLSKVSPANPAIAERFELFIDGMEVANGFSELNDPKEQYDRFLDQAAQRERGDDEAMVLDEDYIRALSYGMPPAAGIGIGIDRLVMLLTNKQSIRDVILFPHMRPE